MKKISVVFNSFPDYSSNARALYEYMNVKYGESMNLVWVVSDETTKKTLDHKNIKNVLLHSKNFDACMRAADVIFTTHCNLMDYKNEKTLYIDLWHGIGPKKSGFLEKKVEQSDIMWMEKVEEKVDYFILPSEFWTILFSCFFDINIKRFLPLGYPKLDLMIKNGSKNKLNKVIGGSIKNYSKIILYAPTFSQRAGFDADGIIASDNILNLKEYDEEKLISFLNKNNYLLCLKLHPSEIANRKVLQNDNIKTITNETLQLSDTVLEEILNAFDMLITDYSSLGQEFIFLEKPVLFVNGNMNSYTENRGIIFDNYEFWTSGPIVNSIEDLLKNIVTILKNNKNTLSKTNKKLWFSNLKNGGSDKICDFIFASANTINPSLQINTSKIKKLKNEIKTEEERIETLKQKMKETEKKVKELDEKNFNLNKQLEEKEDLLNTIINSKGWKLLESVRKIINKDRG